MTRVSDERLHTHNLLHNQRECARVLRMDEAQYNLLWDAPTNRPDNIFSLDSTCH